MSERVKKAASETHVRLNLGAGNQPYRGFQGVDLGGYAANIIHDLRDPLLFPDNSVDEIMASHIIEHFPLWQIDGMLNDWNRVLKAHTGVFWGFVPDGEAVAELYLQSIKEKDWGKKRVWISNFCGGFSNSEFIGAGQVHHAVYDEDLLREKLSIGHFNPIYITREHPGDFDYRLTFICGKGVFDPADPPLSFKVAWAPWREEGLDAGT